MLFKGLKNLGPYVVLVSCFLTTALFLMSKNSILAIADKPFLALSQYFSLIAATLLSWAYVLSTRARFLEKLFGSLDRIYRVHHVIGITAFILVLYHPTLLVLNAWGGDTSPLQYFFVGKTLENNFGVVAFYLLIALLALTLYNKIPYHLWKISHQFMGVVLVFVGLHIGTITSDVSRNEPLKIWMLSVVAVGISAYMYKLIIYKNFTSKYNYVVDEIIKKGSIFELILNPKNENRPMIFEAGQYVFMRTADFKIGPEEHPFSISSPTNSKKIRLAIKILGDYTEQLSKIQKGAKLYLYGPYGDFSSKINTTPRIIAIAGGIGITPFLSILGSNMTDPATKMHLFYCTNNETDAVYKNELIATTKETSNIEIIFWYSSIKGKIQAAKTLAPEMGVFMQDARKDVRNTLVMLCGPTEMMASLAKQFIELGVPRKNIVFEDFALK